MMSPEQVEELKEQVEEFLDSKDLDYTVSVGCFEDEGIIYVSVDTWEVSEDPNGCASEIRGLVEGEFVDLYEKDTECHEMVMVTFEILEDDEDEEEWELFDE